MNTSLTKRMSIKSGYPGKHMRTRWIQTGTVNMITTTSLRRSNMIMFTTYDQAKDTAWHSRSIIQHGNNMGSDNLYQRMAVHMASEVDHIMEK